LVGQRYRNYGSDRWFHVCNVQSNTVYLVGLITLGNRVKPSQTDNKKYFMTTALEATDKNFEKMMQMLSPAQ
jgi:hypothetical protein